MFSMKFQMISLFKKVSCILNVALVSLCPLTQTELYQTINSSLSTSYWSWEEFVSRMDVLQRVLVLRGDATYMFFHPAFREWLIRRDSENASTKFLCDLR